MSCPPEPSNTFHLFQFYLYTLAVSPSLGGSRQHKETTKTVGVLLRSSSNDEGPSRVWMALLEQHSPSSPVFHNLRHFIDANSPTAPTTGLPLRQPCGNSRCQSELRHNHSPLIPIPSTLTCLPHIHPPIIQGSLYSIHPPKLRPPSSTSPFNFCILPFSAVIHYPSSPHDRSISKHSYLLLLLILSSHLFSLSLLHS